MVAADRCFTNAAREAARTGGVGSSLGNPGRDQPRARRLVIPRDDPVVQTEDEIRQPEIVVARRRESLEGQTPVVGDVTCGTSLKRRQAGHRFGRVWHHELA